MKQKWQFKRAALREARGKMTETEMAKRLYRSSSYIKGIEAGTWTPSVKTIIAICHLTGKAPKFFFEVTQLRDKENER